MPGRGKALWGAAILVLACALGLAWFWSASDDNYIYLLAGQSNMVGQGDINDLPPGFPRYQERLKVWRDGTLRPLVSPLHAPQDNLDLPVGVGPGESFAEEMARLSGKNIILVPCAKSATHISQWLPGTPFYQSLVARALQAQTRGTLKGLLWFQGEKDSEKPALAARWSADFATLLAGLRHDLSRPDLPVVLAQLARAEGKWTASCPAWEEIKRQQARIHGRHLAMVRSDDLALIDGIHLTTPAQLTLGRRFANAMCLLQAR